MLLIFDTLFFSNYFFSIFSFLFLQRMGPPRTDLRLEMVSKNKITSKLWNKKFVEKRMMLFPSFLNLCFVFFQSPIHDDDDEDMILDSDCLVSFWIILISNVLNIVFLMIYILTNLSCFRLFWIVIIIMLELFLYTIPVKKIYHSLQFFLKSFDIKCLILVTV